MVGGGKEVMVEGKLLLVELLGVIPQALGQLADHRAIPATPPPDN